MTVEEFKTKYPKVYRRLNNREPFCKDMDAWPYIEAEWDKHIYSGEDLAVRALVYRAHNSVYRDILMDGDDFEEVVWAYEEAANSDALGFAEASGGSLADLAFHPTVVEVVEDYDLA